MEPGSNPACAPLHSIEVDGCLLSREGFSVLASRRLIQSWLIGMTVDSRTMLPAQEMMGNLLSAFLSFCPLGACLSDSLPVIFCLLFHLSAGLSYFLFIYFFLPLLSPWRPLCMCPTVWLCPSLHPFPLPSSPPCIWTGQNRGAKQL